MSSWFAWLRGDDNWGTYLAFFVFVVLPLLVRLGKWLLTRLGLLTPDASPPQAGQTLREELQRRREERKRAEEEGEELWRQLARGEVAEAPAPSAPSARPTRLEAPSAPLTANEVSLESEEEPEPLGVLGRVSEPAEAPEASLEEEREPEPLAALAQASEPPPAEALRRRLVLSRADLRRAVVLSEVLGPPVSERRIGA